jgi:hypothetical protein
MTARNSADLAEPFSELRVSLGRLQTLLQMHERQFADVADRTPPVSAAVLAARRLRALLRR